MAFKKNSSWRTQWHFKKSSRRTQWHLTQKQSEAVAFEWHFVLSGDCTLVPKYTGEATLILLFSGALRLVGVTTGVFCSSQVFGQGSVVICFVMWAF